MAIVSRFVSSSVLLSLSRIVSKRLKIPRNSFRTIPYDKTILLCVQEPTGIQQSTAHNQEIKNSEYKRTRNRNR